MRRLSKSTKDKKVSGVCAGVGQYFGIDPTIVRIGFVILTLATAVIPCLIGYIFADWVMPKDNEV
ncbi:hypothetical protein GCM10008967_04390 [Bacillus carboniphilus]|uniref:Phage shock protein PspC N-terminal domain-containing protein n=1 Tax=Bacillus carboniphilus TaxID=86663 RepID=A0ABN0VTG4_9BACI